MLLLWIDVCVWGRGSFVWRRRPRVCVNQLCLVLLLCLLGRLKVLESLGSVSPG